MTTKRHKKIILISKIQYNIIRPLVNLSRQHSTYKCVLFLQIELILVNFVIRVSNINKLLLKDNKILLKTLHFNVNYTNSPIIDS